MHVSLTRQLNVFVKNNAAGLEVSVDIHGTNVLLAVGNRRMSITIDAAEPLRDVLARALEARETELQKEADSGK